MLRAEWNRCEDSSPESLRHRDDVMRLRPQWHIAPSRPVPVLSSRRMPETKPRAAVARVLLPLAVPEIHVLLCQNRGGGKSRTSNATTLVSLRGWQVLDGDDEAPPIFPTHPMCVGPGLLHHDLRSWQEYNRDYQARPGVSSFSPMKL